MGELEKAMMPCSVGSTLYLHSSLIGDMNRQRQCVKEDKNVDKIDSMCIDERVCEFNFNNNLIFSTLQVFISIYISPVLSQNF